MFVGLSKTSILQLINSNVYRSSSFERHKQRRREEDRRERQGGRDGEPRNEQVPPAEGNGQD